MTMQYLTLDQLLLALDRRPGLIPSAFVPGERKLVWTDLEAYHPYEGFFTRAIDRFAALKQSRHPEAVLAQFVTNTSVLNDPRILQEQVSLSGFIFHAGRCGSTLLARVLASDRRHLVIGEAAAHNQVWGELTNDGAAALTGTAENKRIYRHLLLAMGRKRLPQHEAYFVKFTSFNILFFDFIRNVFPDVPAIFLYREPPAILASYAKGRPAWFESSDQGFRRLLTNAGVERDQGLELLGSPAAAITAFFAAGLHAGQGGARLLNYADLLPDNLPLILKSLNTVCTLKQLTRMQAQFRFDSKVDHRAAEFPVRALPPATSATAKTPDSALQELYNQLVESDLNLFRSGIAAKKEHF